MLLKLTMTVRHDMSMTLSLGMRMRVSLGMCMRVSLSSLSLGQAGARAVVAIKPEPKPPVSNKPGNNLTPQSNLIE